MSRLHHAFRLVPVDLGRMQACFPYALFAQVDWDRSKQAAVSDGSERMEDDGLTVYLFNMGRMSRLWGIKCLIVKCSCELHFKSCKSDKTNLD